MAQSGAGHAPHRCDERVSRRDRVHGDTLRRDGVGQRGGLNGLAVAFLLPFQADLECTSHGVGQSLSLENHKKNARSFSNIKLSIHILIKINQSINQSITQSINQSINQAINQSLNRTNQSINQAIGQSINQSIEGYTNGSTKCPPVSLSETIFHNKFANVHFKYTHRFSDGHKSMTKPSPRRAIPANVRKSPIMITVRRAKRHLLNGLIQKQLLKKKNQQTKIVYTENQDQISGEPTPPPPIKRGKNHKKTTKKTRKKTTRLDPYRAGGVHHAQSIAADVQNGPLRLPAGSLYTTD